MRNFTIKRNKSFVGCAATLKVYIQDSESSEITIKNVGCRKLGELKNGEEKTFEISNEETRIFVIADKLSKDFCVDMKKLPAGEEDVFASGACKFNLGKGNAFRFDGEADDETQAVRSGGAKKGRGIIAISVIIGVLIGLGTVALIYNLRDNTPKDFSVKELTITLNRSFEEEKNEGFAGYLYSKNVAIFIMREGFSDFEYYEFFNELTVEEYADLFADVNNFNTTSKTEDGIVFTEHDFTNEANGKTYTYFITFYKSDAAFWAIEFVTRKDQAEKYRSDVIDWAKSVRFG